MRPTFSLCVLVILVGLFIAPTFAVADSIVFSGFGADAAAIQSTVDNFRMAIGGVNNGNAPGPFDTG